MRNGHKQLSQAGRYRNLSGERLEVARKVYKQDLMVTFSLVVLVIIGDFFMPEHGTVFGFVAAVTVFVLGLWRFSRHETFMRLRATEIKASKKAANDARLDLEEFANKLESKK